MMWEAVCSMEGDASTTSVAEHSSSAAAARPQRQSIGEIENEVSFVILVLLIFVSFHFWFGLA